MKRCVAFAGSHTVCDGEAVSRSLGKPQIHVRLSVTIRRCELDILWRYSSYSLWLPARLAMSHRIEHCIGSRTRQSVGCAAKECGGLELDCRQRLARRP